MPRARKRITLRAAQVDWKLGRIWSRMSVRWKRWLQWSTSVLAVMTAGLWWFGVFEFLDGPFDDIPFDRTTWIRMRDKDDRDNPRGQMVESLVENLEEHRPTRDEVIRLLGPSEFGCGVLSPPIGPKETCLSYNLGEWSGHRLDVDTLDIY